MKADEDERRKGGGDVHGVPAVADARRPNRLVGQHYSRHQADGRGRESEIADNDDVAQWFGAVAEPVRPQVPNARNQKRHTQHGVSNDR